MEDPRALLAQVAAGLGEAKKCLQTLLSSPDRAWRAFACGLLAEELGDETP
jgi:hypothetical protein